MKSFILLTFCLGAIEALWAPKENRREIIQSDFLSDVPSLVPSDQPSTTPSDSPSGGPITAFLAAVLSDVPSMVPSDVPSQVPSDQPSTMPSDSPSGGPNTAFFAAALSDVPSMVPSDQPSSTSSDAPSAVPIAVARATVTSDVPSLVPSDQPTTITSNVPSDTPSTSFATEPLPTSGSILGFTLVNADTREELMAFEDGDTISLSSVNTTFLSLRADTDESVVDKVRFSFEGIENTEGEAPYALFGKRGGGSYIAVASLAVPGIKTLTVEAFDKNDEVVDDVWMSFNVEE